MRDHVAKLLKIFAQHFLYEKIYKRLNTIYNALVWNNYEYESYKDWELIID